MTRSLHDSPAGVVAAGRSLTLVAGLPGAGKSTLLRGLARRPGLAVLDSETQRRALSMLLPARTPYFLYRPVVHLLHRAAIVQRAFGRTDSVVVHLPPRACRSRLAQSAERVPPEAGPNRTRRTAEAVVGVVLGSIARPEALIFGRYDARGRLRVAGPSGSPASCAPARRRPPSSASCALPQWFAARESSS
ncbi:MAG: hypothetical protein QOK43_3376 [Acidimicrobiaceae bacterium]|nr:hypothetical protein [Acidimicrobiaceae bacterium]